MKRLSFVLIFFLFGITFYGQNVIVVIIDGARYTETFGDTARRFVPYMDSLSHYGTIVDKYYNRHKTYTSQAIPALWTGSWAGTRDTVIDGQSTQYTLRPSIFEYYRKQRNVPEDSCIYTLKYVSSLWRQSFYPEYGPAYWPLTVSEGSSDIDVEQRTKEIITQYHPRFLWMYLAEVDHAGHTGDWQYYTNAIRTADSLVADLWNFIQQDTFYSGKTYLLVTNDHGRHDDQHGGFQNHGCSCEGCQHIMFLALGPNIKQNYVSTQEYETQDFAVTIANILNVNPQYADGQVIDDIFLGSSSGIENSLGYNYDLKVINKQVFFRAQQSGNYVFSVYSLDGKKVRTEEVSLTGEQYVIDLTDLLSGVYVLAIRKDKHFLEAKKLILYP